MKKLEKINRALENVRNEETAVLAEKWILRKAYQLNKADLLKQVERIKYTVNAEGEKTERELSEEEMKAVNLLEEEIASYNEGIETLDGELTDFNPTAKDTRIMRLIAFANRDESNEEVKGRVRFGKPTFKVGETKHTAILGWEALCRNMEYFKHVQRNNSDSSKIYKDAFDNLQDTLTAVMRWMYCTDNTSQSPADHTVVFEDKVEFKVTPKFVNYMASLSCFETSVIGGKLEERFSANTFFNSFCAWFYVAMTKGDKFETRYTAPAFKKFTETDSNGESAPAKAEEEKKEESALAKAEEEKKEESAPAKAEETAQPKKPAAKSRAKKAEKIA